MIAQPVLAPATPAIVQPAAYQASFGLVTGSVPRGTKRVLVVVRGRKLADERLRGRRFSVRVQLPTGELTVKVVTVGAQGRRSSAVVRDVYGLPAAARPREVRSRNDPYLARRLRSLLRRYSGNSAAYVQNLGHEDAPDTGWPDHAGRVELDELHVDEVGAGEIRQRLAVA